MNHPDCTAPAPNAAAVALCVAHLIAGVAAAFAAIGALALWNVLA